MTVNNGVLVAAGSGNVTMLDVLNALQEPAGSPQRRRLLGNCAGGNIFNNECQDNSYVIQWQTNLGMTVNPAICYWRTYEFKRRDGACFNWLANAKTWTNTMGVVGQPGVYQDFSFAIASVTASNSNPGIYYTPLGNACVYYTLHLSPSTAGSGTITVYLFCIPPAGPQNDAGTTWTGLINGGAPNAAGVAPTCTATTCCTGCMVNYIDYTGFIPGTLSGQSATNPCFSNSYSASGYVGGSTSVYAPYPTGNYVGATKYNQANARPTGEVGCHEYFAVFKATNADATYTTASTDVGSIPASGPYLPVPPQAPAGGGGRHLLVIGSTIKTSNPNTNSDARLKEGIVSTGLLLAGLPVYSWQWNGAAKALALDWQPTSGVMAQEAMLVYPEVVSVDHHGYYRVDYAALRHLDAAATAVS
jgi:hypothetical protein